ncbi:hypothetical protein PMW_97 [Pseudomonas phage phiPMW]|uniref:Uncharacterized protein n=1 Tax=Pseudomonas phage phiPMW TaxID=1815582 RepID=A0A1S5R1C7_9CAUD|nr:hypothetical protein FDG97_gp097 [Pseudomonas phage phiPMW]ANA49222.1 hypothetical protein PMW_97 [Pseudomonas phage phiPMW]
MNEMLVITKAVLIRRYNELPSAANQKTMRQYFEDGCLCIDGGDLPLVPDEPDDIACMYYNMWCGCSRHHDASNLVDEFKEKFKYE